MLKTSNWYESIAVDNARVRVSGGRHWTAPTLSPEERHRLATAPLPAIRVVKTTPSSHASGPVRHTVEDWRD